VVKQIFILALLSLTLCNFSAKATTKVVASVDKNPVMINESFILEITADDDVDSDAFDSSALLKDFIVGRTSVSSQTSMINFKTSRTTRWSTVLIARNSGSFTIPPFTIDGQQSRPITLEVIENQTQGSQTQDIFIDNQLSSDSVYVQQQLSYTVKLYFAAELRRGSLTEPKFDGANIQQLGKDEEATEIINGRRYRVITRTYTISPQRSGTFTIEAPIFDGEITAQGRRSMFSSLGQSKPVSAVGKSLEVNVKAIPESYQGLWLPSELLTIHQDWQNDSKVFRVGEPLTRTITITAAGLAHEQLPDIELALPDTIKAYPDQPQLHTRLNQGILFSQQVQSFALVASVPGTYTLPEIRIPWWNTKTNRMQEAILPAETIQVEAGLQTLPAPSPTVNQAPSIPVPVEQNTAYLQWFFLAGWLLTASAWLITANRQKFKRVKLSPGSQNHSPYLELLAACKQNRGQQALTALIPWGQKLKPQAHIANLNDLLASVQDEDLHKAVTQLQSCYYAKTPLNWQGQHLALAVQKIQQQTGKAKTVSPLKLNP
jgi:hypothetical protein